MLSCRHCDARLGWAVKYCPYCGKSQARAEVVEVAPPLEPIPIPAQPRPAKPIEPRLEDDWSQPLPTVEPATEPVASVAPVAPVVPPPGRPPKAPRQRRDWWPALFGVCLTASAFGGWYRYRETRTMIPIPAGSFIMGCAPSLGRGCNDSETPAHRVDVAAFELGRHEVTFAEWDACAAAGGCPKKPNDWGSGQRPVINVSWEDAQQYLAWLNGTTHKAYRLPTEAE